MIWLVLIPLMVLTTIVAVAPVLLLSITEERRLQRVPAPREQPHGVLHGFVAGAGMPRGDDAL
jgi:hypothetical protein